MGDDRRLGHVDLVVPQAPVGGARHRDHGVGDAHDGLEDLLLANAGVHQDRMEHHDGRYGQLVEQGEDLVAVGPAEDAVLMLDDGDIELVERRRCPAPAWWGALQQIVHDLGRRPRLKLVDHSHDAEVLRACPGPPRCARSAP